MNLVEGDIVRIEPLDNDEKNEYPHGWNLKMDQYLGETTKILSIVSYSGEPSEEDEYYLECDDCEFMWSCIHLTKVEPQKLQLF